MTVRKIIAVYSENYMKLTKALCGQSAELLTAKRMVHSILPTRLKGLTISPIIHQFLVFRMFNIFFH
jgi:hypothetical protein